MRFDAAVIERVLNASLRGWLRDGIEATGLGEREAEQLTCEFYASCRDYSGVSGLAARRRTRAGPRRG